LIGLTGMNYFSNLDESSASVQFTETHLPNLQNHALYMRYFEVFERLSSKLEPDFELITALQ